MRLGLCRNVINAGVILVTALCPDSQPQVYGDLLRCFFLAFQRLWTNLLQMLHHNLNTVQILCCCCCFPSHFLPPHFCLPDILGSGQALGQALLWCHTDVAWGGGCSNKPNRWVMGAFGGRMCVYHRHAQAQGLASTQCCLSHPFTHSHTYAPTLTEGRVWVRRRKGGLRQSVSVYGLYQARCAVACRECW